MKKHQCDQCKLRKTYDEKPKSFVGRFWRWHINFCPGWNGYMKSLDETKREQLVDRYKLASH